ncbi:MAG: sigma-70 family RNA polymerase sigma factor [Chloroflexi bacterium]|nr:sigma-70 family RNA polymerase sigma factor [Chloroflexota bacterium]
MDTADAIALAPAGSPTRETLVAELDGHGPMLLAAARVITLDTAEAEDLVQTTFEIALRRLDDLREPRAMRAWLLTIQTREAFRVVRRLRRLVSLDGRVAEIPSPWVDLAQRTDLRQALGRLPRRTRAAIALHHLAGLSVADTAQALGVSENTVKSQLKTGLGRLREELRGG